MKRPSTYIIASGFTLLLLLPTLDQLLGLSSRFGSTENRQLSEVPHLHFPHVRSFVQQFDRYYKENFGWRNALFYVYSRWKVKVLAESPLPEKVIVGKQGWFYLGNSYNKIMDQHRGLYPLSADSARFIADHLAVRQQELAKQGIRLYIFIAPDSQTIYPENLPDHLQPSPDSSRLDKLKAAVVKYTNLPFVDIRDTLRQAKRQHIVYNQTDTHWNEYGTLIGCATLLDRIHQDQPTLPSVRSSDYRIEQQKGGGGDLVTMLALQKEIKDSVFYLITPAPNLAGRQIATVPNEVSGFPSTRFSGPGTGRLLLIGDSFSHSMMQFLPGYFKASYFVRGNKLDPTLVRAEKPTVVVVEIVERNISLLARL
jgi:hypothetical protein